MIRPTRRQYIIAAGWPLRIWIAVHLLFFLVPLLAARPYPGSLSDPRAGLVFLASVAGLLVAGFYLSLLTAACAFEHLRPAWGEANGAPYEVGEHVQILVGKHRGRVACIHKVWSERGQLRLELGEQEKRSVTDVFAIDQVLRVGAPDERGIKDKTPSRGDTPHHALPRIDDPGP